MTDAFIGQTATITATLTNQTAGTLVASGALKLFTNPPGRAGDGDTATTNGSGEATFAVLETEEGTVRYLVAHEYTEPGVTPTLTCRGAVQVRWKPAYTMTLSSPDGTELDPDGEPHDLIAGLALTATNAAVIGRTIRLTTDPPGEVGDGKRGVTGSDGTVTFKVSDEDSETVTYTADLPPSGAVNTSLAIQWGTDLVFATFGCNGVGVVGVPLPVVVGFLHADCATPYAGVSFTTSPNGEGGTTDGTGTCVFDLNSSVAGDVVYALATVNGQSPADVLNESTPCAVPISTTGTVTWIT